MSNDTLWEKLAVQEDQIKDLLAENEALRKHATECASICAEQAERIAELERVLGELRDTMASVLQQSPEGRAYIALIDAALSGRG